MDIYVNIKKVAIYSRKSRPDETEDALQRQLQVLIDMSVKNGWEWEVYQEIGSSMSIDERDRPELNKLLRKIQAYEYDGVLVTDADRLSRDMEHSAYIKKMFTGYGVKLITTTKVYDYNIQEDDLMSDMMSVLAKQEYVNTKKRLMRGKIASAREGKWQGKPPLGYKIDRDTKKLVIDETEAPIVKEIFQLYIDGSSSNEIAQKFDYEGILTPIGGRYTHSRIGRILKNEVYKGDAVFGRTFCSKVEKYDSGLPKQLPTALADQIIVEKAHPSIIADKDWEKVEMIRNARSQLPPAARIGKNPFSTLIGCSICGRTVTFQLDRQGRLTMGSCRTRSYAKDGSYTTCPNQGLLLSTFEEVFYEQFTKFIKSLEAELEYIKSNMNEGEVFSPQDEINEINKKIKKIVERIKKAQQAFLAEILDEAETKEEIRILKYQRKELEREIEVIKNTPIENKVDVLEELVSEFKDILLGTTELHPKEVNGLFRSVIDRIEYTRMGEFKGSRKATFSINIRYK